VLEGGLYDRIVSDFSRMLIRRSGYESDAFADLYDRYRIAPPRELVDVLTLVLGMERPRLVVDLGAGTGLSTRAWAGRASQVVGVEANAYMVERARRATREQNVAYRERYAADTGLTDGAADLVTCAQAFHWMEPGPVLAEAARLVRPGGVFAAYDYDVPPVVHPEIDEAFAVHLAARREARKLLGREAGAESWPKDGHLAQIQASGRFRFAREIVCHGFDECDAERLLGLAESLGGPRGIFGRAAPQVERTYERLREVAERIVGARTRSIVVCYRIRFGVT
jgi:SAM-dependent methyltransferase